MNTDLKLKKDSHLLLRINQRIKSELKTLAESKGMSMTEYIDHLLMDSFKSEGVKINVEIF